MTAADVPPAAADMARRLAALRRIALAVVRRTGPSEPALLHDLMAEVVEALPADGAMVAVYADTSCTTLRTLAVRLDGQALPDFEYPVRGSPCERVLGAQFRYTARGVLDEVDPHSPFAAEGLDAYAAFPLADSRGTPLGVLAALGRSAPVADGDAEHAEVVLKVVASRVAGELERRQALEALRRSEASYRAIFDSAESAIYVHDWDTYALIDANPRACEDHGRTRDELLGAPPTELLGGEPPYDLHGALQRLRDAKLGRCAPFEWQVRVKDGRLRWWEIHLKPAQLDGRPCLLAYTHDVTERKVTEDRLRASEAQYRAIFDASADALVLWDSRLRRVDANPADERLFGFPRDEAIGGGLENLPDPVDDVRPRVEMLRRALAGEASRAELEVMRRDGSRVLVEMRAIPFEHRGEPHALQIARDITERKAAELRLRASEEQHRTIFNASVDGMLVKDADNIVVDVNDAYLRMHGYAREDLLGRCLLDYLPPALGDACRDLLPAVMAGTPCHFETQTWRADHSLLDVEVHGVPVVYGGRTRALVIMRDITERKLNEERLRASEEQYRSIFHASSDALMLWDGRLRRVDVNPAHQRIFGYERDEVVGRGFDGLDYPDELAQPRIEMVRRALAGEASHAEVEAQRKGGERIVTELRTIPFRHRGAPHVLQIARDVTERRTAEARLRASEAQYRAIFDATDDALILWNSRYERVDVNPAYERLFGWTRHEVLGRSFEAYSTDPAYVEPRRSLVTRALAGETCRAELRYVRKDGREIDTEIHTVPFTHQGQPHVLAIARDITQRKRADARLREREEQYRAIFDGSADPMTLWNARLEVVDVNEAFERLKGCARERVVGRHWSERPDAIDMPALLPHIRGALDGRESQVLRRVTRGDGGAIDMELRYLPVRIGGEPHVLGIGRDITGRLQLESQLRQAQKMEAIGQLTGGIAHDFNNILTSVLGYVAMAEERAEGGPDQRLRRQLGQARQAAERARDLVAQMLAFARRKGSQRQALTPARLVRESIGLLRSTLPSSVLLETAGLDDDLPEIEADAVQLSQVLMNLVINARDAVDGSGRVGVALRASDRAAITAPSDGDAPLRCRSCAQALGAGRWVVLAVSDNGSGIAPDVLPRIFDPFFSTKPAGRGTGMGLAMVHGIVHEHGGHVDVRTWAGEGSCFEVWLPAADAGAGAPPHAPAPERERPGSALRGHVLLVEDDPQAGDYLAERLQAWGLDVTLQRDPLEARAWLDAAPRAPDLLLTDLTMPHLSGLQLAGCATARHPGLPVLLISGDLGEADAAAREAAGITETLAKPLDAAALREVLGRLLQPVA